MSTSSALIGRATVHHIEFDDWASIIPFVDRADGWVFRGQLQYSTSPLQTSLNRAAEFLGEAPVSLEQRILREFKRRAILSGEPNLPQSDEIFQWLALLQHYGAPTRFLDFTHSVFVALFFAVDRASADSEIWCVRRAALSRNLPAPWNGDKNASLKRLIEPTNGTSTPKPPTAVFMDEPYYVNRRLALQQGCFLVPYDVSQSFIENLFSVETGLEEGHDTNLPSFREYITQLNYFRIVIRKAQHSRIRRQLRRMNMTREHLFPGLDGMASSFWQEV